MKPPLKRRRRFTLSFLKSLLLNPTALTVGVIGVVIALYAVDTPVLDAIERNWLDLRFRTRGPIPPTPTVVLAVIDEKSLQAEGRWPWPRSTIARSSVRCRATVPRPLGSTSRSRSPTRTSGWI